MSIDPGLGSFAVCASMMVGSVIAAWAIEHFGRKRLLIFSCMQLSTTSKIVPLPYPIIMRVDFLTCACMSGLGAFFYVKEYVAYIPDVHTSNCTAPSVPLPPAQPTNASSSTGERDPCAPTPGFDPEILEKIRLLPLVSMLVCLFGFTIGTNLPHSKGSEGQILSTEVANR